MKNSFMEEDVRTRLILSGISELRDRGVRDFSLRRAAEEAGVSCAAPYRYFKDKESYISGIISYIFEKWKLLCREVENIYAEDGVKLVSELAIAAVRFRLANEKILSSLFISEHRGEVGICDFDKPITEAVSRLKGVGTSPSAASDIRALIHGYVALILGGELSPGEKTEGAIRSAVALFLS